MKKLALTKARIHGLDAGFLVCEACAIEMLKKKFQTFDSRGPLESEAVNRDN